MVATLAETILELIPVSRPTFITRPDSSISMVLDSGWLGQGQTVYEFETALASFIGATDVIAVGTGTHALELALRAFALKEKEYVVIPNLTFVATAHAVLNAGYRVLLCDSDSKYLNICPKSLEKILLDKGDKIAAIINMHYGGMAVGISNYINFSKVIDFYLGQGSIPFIEDAAHSFGSCYLDDERACAVGSDKRVISCFSFDPIKNITSIEGGAIVYSSRGSAVSDTLRRMRMLGISKDSFKRKASTKGWNIDVITPGFRYHMSNVNAAVGLVQLGDSIELFSRRQMVLMTYIDVINKLFVSGGSRLRMPQGYLDFQRIVPFCFSISCDDRDLFSELLAASFVGSTVNWLTVCSFQLPGVESTVDLSVSESFANESLSLPMHASLSDENMMRIVDAILRF